MKIYTKRGDAGQTSLIGGTTVKKNDQRLHAYGTVDELNSFVGLLRGQLPEANEHHIDLERIQNQLFQVGSHLACESDELRQQLPPFSGGNAELLEQRMDVMTTQLPELKNFILPGGSVHASHAHLCRTVCRRAERNLFAIGELSDSEKTIGVYLNRLSDYFFVLARWLNFQDNVPDVIWRKDI